MRAINPNTVRGHSYENFLHENLLYESFFTRKFPDLQGYIRLVHNTILKNALHYVIFPSTLIEMQHNAGIDSDLILAFPYVAFLCVVVKKSPTFLITNLCVSQINATLGLSSLCDPALTQHSLT